MPQALPSWPRSLLQALPSWPRSLPLRAAVWLVQPLVAQAARRAARLSAALAEVMLQAVQAAAVTLREVVATALQPQLRWWRCCAASTHPLCPSPATAASCPL